MKIVSSLFIFFLFLLFAEFNTIQSQEILVTENDIWSYYDKGDLDKNWITLTDFSSWQKGESPLGYGDSKNKTVLSYGPDKEKKHVSKYFKKTINITGNYVAYEFKIQRDDGAVVYINGKELFRDNMPNANIKNSTLALSTVKGKAEHLYKQHFFDNTIFKKGENNISVSIHQSYPTSSDCIFSLAIIGHNNPEVLAFVVDNKNKTNEILEYKIKTLNSKFEYDKVLLKNEGLENTNYNLKFLIFLISIFFILSLVGYIFVISTIKKKNKEKNLTLERLRLENLSKEKEMITLSANLLHNKQYFKEIKADLKGLKTEDIVGVKGIINQVDYVLERDEEWKILKKHFNAVHNNFYDKIIEKHPTISETELRHCMFIKLHMQTKEIAKILFIDPRSVQTGRYRIKKKMNLREDEDLRAYLLDFT